MRTLVRHCTAITRTNPIHNPKASPGTITTNVTKTFHA
jgi:hypothetical protein